MSANPPRSDPPVLDYAAATSTVEFSGWWPSVVWLALSVVLVPLFYCACGHMGTEGFLVTLPAFAFACYGWIRNPDMGLGRRSLLILVVLLSVCGLFKNLVDVLWLGHEALLA